MFERTVALVTANKNGESLRIFCCRSYPPDISGCVRELKLSAWHVGVLDEDMPVVIDEIVTVAFIFVQRRELATVRDSY